MSPEKRDYLLYLEDMYESMLRIEEYLDSMGFTEFKMTRLVVDAVIRNFEVIGEAANKIPKSVQDRYPEIPWRKMYGLRNLIAHEYFGIDYEMIWKIAKNDLQQNCADLRRVIINEKPSI